MWCVPTLDNEYVARMEAVLGLYEQPLDPRRPVVCLDERPVQLLQDARPGKPLRAGRVTIKDYEYVRRGTANVFCAVEPKAGKHMIKATANRKAESFAEMTAAGKRRPTPIASASVGVSRGPSRDTNSATTFARAEVEQVPR